jgi:hypothetical protein
MAEAWEEKRLERVTSDTLVASILSAPWTVWVGVTLYLAIAVIHAAIEPRVGTFIALLVALPFTAGVMIGLRILWQTLIVFAVGDIVFVFAPHQSALAAAVSAVGLVFLLLPASRRYFRPGRIYVWRRD